LNAYHDDKRQFVPVSFPRLSGQTIYDKRDGHFLNLKIRRKTSDWSIFQQIFIQEEYRLVDFKQAAALLEHYRGIVSAGATPLIIDCGANNGLSCVWLARTFPEAQIIGVEPETANFATAQANVAAIPNIRILNAAVAAHDSTLTIHDPGMGTSGFQTKVARDSDSGIPAYAIETLVSLARKQGQGELIPFLCKIDIEGFEEPLFSENTGWIDDFPIIIIELHDWLYPGAGTSTNFLKAIAFKSRDFLFRGENVFSIKYLGN
jgi:FkbM family methyltransferase